MNLLAHEEPTRFHEQKLVNQIVRQQCEGKISTNQSFGYLSPNEFKKMLTVFRNYKTTFQFFLSPFNTCRAAGDPRSYGCQVAKRSALSASLPRICQLKKFEATKNPT